MAVGCYGLIPVQYGDWVMEGGRAHGSERACCGLHSLGLWESGWEHYTLLYVVSGI